VNALAGDPLADLAVLLADEAGPSPCTAFDRRHYGDRRLGALAALRPRLEAELIASDAPAGPANITGYIEAMLAEIRGAPENDFIDFLAGATHRDDHYRNFLVQSSPDLLAEASASALGVIGEYGEPQSALFRILIDEFGYGAHHKKHAVLYRATMRSFGLDDAYNGYWPWFDTAALDLHNTIHWLFQNPGNVFRQMGFLLHAETAYQRSTLAHQQYLRAFHPHADARYFTEHAHIDLHHTRMVIDEVVLPMVARFGAEASAEIIAGAELTKAAFSRAGAHLLEVSQRFAAAPSARFGVDGRPRQGFGRPVTPASALDAAPVQVGVLGVLRDGRDFARFPPTSIGRVLA
jgi:hypothetical protein